MKIFGIGLSKTGTTSLANALQLLGYATRDNLGVTTYASGDLSSVDLNAVDFYTALTDTPIPSFYRELDVRYPGSKFILTVRERNAWLQSCKKQFTRKSADAQNDAHRRLFIDLYGTDVFDVDAFSRGYERFVEGATGYFRRRPGDMLVMDIAGGDGWEKLCPFLGRPRPEVPFPKSNVTKLRWIDMNVLVEIARKGGVALMRYREGSNVSVIDRAILALRGKDRVTLARQAAHLAVLEGLNRLTSEIPVLSREANVVPRDIQSRWNHYWLVDPLDGELAYREGSSAFSLNIALIEDGKPIYGVVHAPARDRTYYGRLGKGAFVSVPGSEAKRLMAGRAVDTATAFRNRPSASRPMDLEAGASLSLAMCTLADQSGGPWYVERPASAWQTAAAQAVLNALGMRVTVLSGGENVTYNHWDSEAFPLMIGGNDSLEPLLP